jgi:two-component system OmpR family sensor kinase
MSLRARVLLGLVAVVIAGLLVADFATYKALESSLIQRTDQQLRDAAIPVEHYLRDQSGEGDRHGPQMPMPQVPGNTYAELRGPFGPITHCGTDTGACSSQPVLPDRLSLGAPNSATPRIYPGTNGVARYDVLAYSDNGEIFVIGIPLTEVDGTLGNLLMLEIQVGLGVLVAMTILAWWIVRLGLKPLERMGETAAAIAAGDLTRRVEPATQRTEVGRLGLALNAMLSQIESAFAERTRSEQRLRRVIADASHELRTPLTSIRGYAELFRRGAAARPDEVALAMRRIEDEATRMSALVDDLLLLARLDQGRPLEREAVDVATVVRDACADARAVDPGRAVTCTIDGAVVVTGDELRLRQVVANLLRNALVHTPPGTPVQVSAARDDGHAVVLVADHGAGLPPNETERIFEPFYRADPGRSRDSGGTGLGLSIVARVVAAHGGAVRVTETPGGGATFRVELPLAGAQEPG